MKQGLLCLAVLAYIAIFLGKRAQSSRNIVECLVLIARYELAWVNIKQISLELFTQAKITIYAINIVLLANCITDHTDFIIVFIERCFNRFWVAK